MGRNLDLDDVANGHWMAVQELSELRAKAGMYEYLRKLNPRQFCELYEQNIRGMDSFDSLVAARIKARAKA